MKDTHRFAVLKVLLSAPAGAETWELICTLFEEWPRSPTKPRALRMAAEALQSWPDEQRHISTSRWWPDAPRGRPRPQWTQLARQLWSSKGVTSKETLAFLQDPRFQSFTELNLSDVKLDAATLQALGEHSPPLRTLELSGTGLGDAGVLTLMRVPAFRQLVGLDLSHNAIGDAGAMALAAGCSSLEWLSLDGNRLYTAGVPRGSDEEEALLNQKIGDEGARSLGRAPFIRSLQSLDLSYQAIHPSGAAQLLAAVANDRLKKLQIRYLAWESSHEQDGYGYAEALGQKIAWRLQELDAYGNAIGDRGLGVLARSGIFEALTWLDLGGNKLTAAGLQELTSVDAPAKLRSLGLTDNNLGPAGIHALVASGWLEGLEHLDLCGTQLGDEGLSILLNSRALRGLKSLQLGYNHGGGLTDRAARELSECPDLQELQSLFLAFNTIGDEGAHALAKSSCFPSLRRLHLFANPITDRGALALVQ
ncbi:MAG: hypothetical protein ACPG4T_14915, partial [Nannocystaceae bacterium]